MILFVLSAQTLRYLYQLQQPLKIISNNSRSIILRQQHIHCFPKVKNLLPKLIQIEVKLWSGKNAQDAPQTVHIPDFVSDLHFTSSDFTSICWHQESESHIEKNFQFESSYLTKSFCWRLGTHYRSRANQIIIGSKGVVKILSNQCTFNVQSFRIPWARATNQAVCYSLELIENVVG